jgi:hypothetical protein
MGPPSTQWTDIVEKRFLLEIIERGAANNATFVDIAKKWGAPHTKASLKYVSDLTCPIRSEGG